MKEKYIIRDGDALMNYALFEPENLNIKELPLLVFLHGAGERGEVIEHIFRHGIPKMIKSGIEISAVVLCPQCNEKFVWNNLIREVKVLIDKTASDYGTMRDRICITGASMGGFGTWEMAMTYTNFFSAAAPVAGGGLSWRASNLITTPISAYHGGADDTVPVIYSELMVNAVNKVGGNASLTVLDGFGHNDGINEAYFNTDLVPKLLSYRRTDFSTIPECLSKYF